MDLKRRIDMTGVEILTSAQIVVESAFDWNLFWTIFILIKVGTVVALLLASSDVVFDWETALGFVVLGAVLGSLIGFIAGAACSTPTAYETQYKVTISDEVSMTEFYEHYEVIDQDGKIFTVREKTNE
jgi:membrane protein DedA with SNARE-associated domain